MSETLLAGAARTDVTPPIGIDIAGFCLRDLTLGLHGSLSIRVVLFVAGEQTAALVTCEMVGHTQATASALRGLVADTLGIEASAVTIGCTHTHSAPVLQGGPKIGGRQEEWLDINEAYDRNFRYQLVSAIKQAQANLRPARSRAVVGGDVHIGVNRRFRMDDGRMIIGRNWSGPMDPSVGVLRVDDMEGRPLCTVLNYACHPIVLGPENNVVSPDYPGMAMRLVEEATGAPCLFFQGCCGDIAPVDGMGHDTTVADLLGAQLGYAALALWSGIETRNIEQHEEIVRSYNWLASLIKEERPPTSAVVRAVERQIPLEMLPLPTPSEIETIAARERAHYEELAQQGAGHGALNIQRIELRWVRAMETALQEGRVREQVLAPVTALRVNDWVMVCLPVEPFVRIGLAIKQQLAPHPVFVSGFTNGTIGYAPLPEDYPEGGYEVERAHHVYGRPTALAPSAPGALIETGISQARELYGLSA